MAVYKSKKYSWGGYSYKVLPEIVGKTMEKIENEKGSVTAESFLDESRPVASPTHSLFEWDDTVAAEKYRLSQASNVISSLKIEFIASTEEEQNLNFEVVSPLTREEKKAQNKLVPAYLNVERKKVASPGRFQNTERAINNPVSKRVILQNAYDELSAFVRKYKLYSEELAEVFKAVEDLKERIDEAM